MALGIRRSAMERGYSRKRGAAAFVPLFESKDVLIKLYISKFTNITNTNINTSGQYWCCTHLFNSLVLNWATTSSMVGYSLQCWILTVYNRVNKKCKWLIKTTRDRRVCFEVWQYFLIDGNTMVRKAYGVFRRLQAYSFKTRRLENKYTELLSAHAMKAQLSRRT